MNTKRIFTIGWAALLFVLAAVSAAGEESWPRRVLITNDNGIEDVKIIALAKAFSEVAETWVIAPMEDRSGSSHYLTATEKGKLLVRPQDLGENIRAYGVDGFPADCVLLAVAGIMRDHPPDLVVSGINGGPNLGKDWLFSGTVGAARIAAFAGLSAMAVSGLDSGIPSSLEAAAQWVVRLAQSPLVRELKPPGYITVSLPRIPPGRIKGVRAADRAGLREIPLFSRMPAGDGEKESETWALTGVEPLSQPLPPDCDLSLCDQGYVVIVPMIADEIHREALALWRERPDSILPWDFKKN